MARDDPNWDDFENWVRTRPRAIQEMMREWPLLCVVRTKPEITLLIPAPGVEGIVNSYFEDGTLGVVAPMTIPHPLYGWGTGERKAEEGELFSAPVRPGELILVREERWTREDVESIIG